MTTAAIVVLDTDFHELAVERSIAAEAGLQLIAPGEAIPAPEMVKAVLIQWAKVDVAVMDGFPRLAVIARLGLGLDQVDIAEATRRGIAVVNSGDYATEEVSVHTIGLLLALVRRIPTLDRAMRAGAWFEAAAVAGVPRLSAMTLGVVGLGNIGARVAQLAAGLGMKVIGFDPKVKSATIANTASLDELLAAADAVTLHVPLSDATRGMIGTRAFGLMRKGAFILNTGRGPLIEERALIAALESGRLGGAGLDVFEQEPLDPDSPLRKRADVVLTPHSAYYSEPSIVDARRRPMEGIVAVLAGRRPVNQVNG